MAQYDFINRLVEDTKKAAKEAVVYFFRPLREAWFWAVILVAALFFLAFFYGE